ncbi:MAG: M6 family metalloprotease domain-containing protein [Bacteroidaceae bacterium]|nr:M6 family metalloprotease domain-containing protein [Bacteroidaceae bacterium]
MKHFSLFVACCLLSTLCYAVPARRVSRVVRQADGTELTVYLQGDESFHYYTTADGTPFCEVAEGYWARDSRDVQTLHRQALERRTAGREQLAQRMRRAMQSRRAPLLADEVTTRRGLLILVNFADLSMINGDKSSELFNQMLNAIGNPYGGNYGSVREYFRYQSYNQFDIEFDVVGPVTLSGNMAYYGANEGGNDKRPGEMIKEACKLVDDQVNFKNYDWDGDGQVENIYVVYAGYSEASGASANTVWPHQWDLASATGSNLILDGTIVSTYACGSELSGTKGSTLDGIGTMCHEYSHCLGLPDFYATGSTPTFGMSEWSIMDYGCYNDNGFCPAGYTSYERWFCGWLEPVELNEGCVVSEMKNIEENPEAYVIYNDKNKKEYYLLENHQKVGWDKTAVGHGMLILHVDYNQNAWYNNTINNDQSHLRMSIIPADNKYNSSSYSGNTYYYANDGDTWPGSKRNTALTDESTPAATLFNANTDGKKLMHKPITEITETNGLISFTFMGGQTSDLEAPVLMSVFEDVDSTKFTARWSKVEGAVSYNLRYTAVAPEGADSINDLWNYVNMVEQFEKFYVEEDATAEGNKDISGELDDYTLVAGWTGSKVYKGYYGAKLGTSRATGYMTTPLMNGETGNLTIYMAAFDWMNMISYKEDGSQVKVSLLDENGELLQSQTVEPSYEEYILLSFSDVPESYYVRFEGEGKRIWLCFVLTLDGVFSDDEIATLFFEEAEEAPARIAARRTLRKLAPRRAPVVTTIENVQDTTYSFTGMKPGYTYTLQVQAVDAEGVGTKWSNEESVTLSATIDAVSALRTEGTRNQNVFDLMGRRVARPVRSGLYIVNGRKMLIK